LTVRSTAEQRRAEIRAAAAATFGTAGLHGTSVETIARTIGISEAYVFRLFGTKRSLFIEVVTDAFDAMTDGMVAAAGDATGVDALSLMGAEYKNLLRNRERLLLQMQGFAACGDPHVKRAVRAAFGRLWTRVGAAAGQELHRVRDAAQRPRRARCARTAIRMVAAGARPRDQVAVRENR